MTLTRSKSGLRSYHRFVNSDVVVYCEGGNSIQHDLDLSSTTLDVYYWSKVVATFQTNKRFHFKSMGSKASLKKIAEEVERNGILTISVCVDADYERHLGLSFDTARTSRTFGYSWENDVLSDDVFIEIVGDFIGLGAKQTATLTAMRAELAAARTALCKWTEIDLALHKRGKGCLFDRQKPAQSLDFDRHPHVREAAFSKRLSELGYKRRPNRVVEVVPATVHQICFGKLISKGLFHFAMSILKQFGIATMQYETFMRQAIACTFRNYTTVFQGSLLTHHAAQARRF